MAETDADPLLTTTQAAQHMGKTYRQFTAYASHHGLERTGDPPRYRLSVIEAAAARSRKPVRSAQVVPIVKPAERQTEQSAEQASVLPSAELTALARQVVDMARRQGELHERLHDKDALLARQSAEHRAEIDKLRQGFEARLEAAKAVPWWGRLFGRGS